MKKVLFAVLMAKVLFFSGCNNLEMPSEKIVVSDRKTVLENIKRTGNYRISEEETFKTLDAFLNKNEDFRNARINTYSLIDSKTVDVNFSSDSRNSESGADSFTFNIYGINGKGYALTSNDRRIGGLLAVIPEGEYGDPENEFTELFDELLDNYVKHSVYLWNELCADNSRSEENETIMTEGHYTFDSEKIVCGNRNLILKTNWEQKDFYNDAIEAVYGKNYCAGCATIGTAQLIAAKQPRLYMETKYYKKVIESWPKARELAWDGSFNWNEIIKCDTELGKVETAALIYEVAEKIGVDYGINSTGAYTSDVENALSEFNLVHEGFCKYEYSSVVESIQQGSPLIFAGRNTKSGHLFNIDGFAEMIVYATHNITDEKIEFRDNFIHCNLGWGGPKNGWYLSGVFDTRTNFNHIEDFDVNFRKIEYEASGTYSIGAEIIPQVQVKDAMVPHAMHQKLVYTVNPGYGYAIYFAGDFEGSERFQNAVRGVYDGEKWIYEATFPDDQHVNWSVFSGRYDLGESIKGGYENLTWTEGENLSSEGISRWELLTSTEDPGYGYAVYFTGTFPEANNWTTALRGDYEDGAWTYTCSTQPEPKVFLYKALIGPYNLGNEVNYSYPGLTQVN